MEEIRKYQIDFVTTTYKLRGATQTCLSKILNNFWKDVVRGKERIGSSFHTETMTYPHYGDYRISHTVTIEEPYCIEDEQDDDELHRHAWGLLERWITAVNQKPMVVRRKLSVELNDVTDIRVFYDGNLRSIFYECEVA